MMILDDLNQRFLALHTAKEDAFWALKMRLRSDRPGAFEAAEVKLQGFIDDRTQLPRIEAALADPALTDEERLGLEGWRRYFRVNAMESEEARALYAKILSREDQLERMRADLRTGYVSPRSGAFARASQGEMSALVRTAPDEGVRKAAWEGLRAIEPAVLAHGFLEVVRERNRFARSLGYEDFYEYRLRLYEGMSKHELFGLLDALVADTHATVSRTIAALVERHGEAARRPWNFSFYRQGSLAAQTDRYFRMETAVATWAQTFAGLGIGYRGAALTLDLVHRSGKHDNGFMHGPVPTLYTRGRFQPAHINFTTNALPGVMDSGRSMLGVLLHEGGHAAHFSNIVMPAPCYSQEYAPTSSAFAETQSMFLDSLVDDVDWLARYAVDAEGSPMPEALMIERALLGRDGLSVRLRWLLVSCYAERRLYEMAERDLTPENVLRLARETEAELLLIDASPTPFLAIPHILSFVSSAYMHSYVLADLAVQQTRAHFLRRGGQIVDNPDVGSALAEHYWRQGNAKTFLEFVRGLTGAELSADALVRQVTRSPAEVADEARLRLRGRRPSPRVALDAADLAATVSLVHGDELISTTRGGRSLRQVSEAFAAWLPSSADTPAKD